MTVTTTDYPAMANVAAHSKRWGWGILFLTGGTSLAFNIGHAIIEAHAPVKTGQTHVPLPLALLYGVAPVAAAMMLSHLIAIQKGGKKKKVATGAVFVAAMSLSMRSIYEVLNPLAHQWGLLFAFMLDVAALLALNEVIADDHKPAPSRGATSQGATHEGGHQHRATTPPDPCKGATSQGATNAGPPTPAGGHQAGATRRQGATNDRGHQPGGRGESAVIEIASRGNVRAVMRACWDEAIAAGRIPSGGDLNRAAGKDPKYSLGKRNRQQWLAELPAEFVTAANEGRADDAVAIAASIEGQDTIVV